MSSIHTVNTKEKLLQKIANKTAKLGVIGLGYVGLPLAVEKAKAGYSVVGFDIQEVRVSNVNKGINYIGDVVDDDLKKLVEQGKLSATSNYQKISELDTISICVPTPLDEYQQPDISYVRSSVEMVGKYMKHGALVVLESTTYPGTTEEIVKPILEKDGKKCGLDFFLAYSPERVDPGNKFYNTQNTPKVVGGVTENCTEIAASLYQQIIVGSVHRVSSPAVAEMEKILENTFRNINIGLANEMAILCHKMKIDIWEVIEAAKTKPYGFMGFYPGPGVGGHCIPIDPWYLTWKAKQFGYQPRLIEVAGAINNEMPQYIVNRIGEILNEQCKCINGSKIQLIGVAYKKDIDDFRESPVIEIIEKLSSLGANVEYHDPYIPSFKTKGKEYVGVPLEIEKIQNADLIVITTDHTPIDYELIAKEARCIFDTRNAMKNLSKKYKYYCL